MNKIDIILLIILGFGLVRGFMRGLIIEMASLLSKSEAVKNEKCIAP